MKHQHDDLANEQNAARAHNAMKWMYRGQNVVLLAVAGAIVAAPKRDRRDQAITAVAVGCIGFAVWINSESAQWHARATDEHRGRAEKLKDRCPRCGALTVNDRCTSCLLTSGVAAGFMEALKDAGYDEIPLASSVEAKGFPDVEEHAAKRIPRRLNLDPQKARGAHA